MINHRVRVTSEFGFVYTGWLVPADPAKDGEDGYSIKLHTDEHSRKPGRVLNICDNDVIEVLP